VVLTEFGRADAEALGFRRIDVIGNGLEDQRKTGESRPRARREGESPRVLHVGHLCPDKGTPTLVTACGALMRRGRQFTLELVGECLPPYSEDELHESIRAAGIADRTTVRGPLTGEALWEAYGRADLFVFSTVAPYESFGLVLVEAMMFNLPAVVTGWRANEEVFGARQGEGPAGGVVAQIEGKSLEAGLVSALQIALERRTEWKKWGQLNRARYESRYSIEVLRSNLKDYFLGSEDAGAIER
jgi:glycosyltransferase involved in cell wall biosynthesis